MMDVHEGVVFLKGDFTRTENMEHFRLPWFHKGKKVKVVSVGDVVER